MLKWIECGNTEQEVRGSSPGGSGEGIVGGDEGERDSREVRKENFLYIF